MKKIITIIIAVAICGFILYFTHANRMSRINEKIHSMNAEVVDIDTKILTNGPFFYKDKNQDIFKVTYKKDNETYVAWVKMGTWSILDKWIFCKD